MARYASARNAFSFGEVSPSSFGRADLEQYRQMCETLKNMVPKNTGGASRRMGTEVIGRDVAPGLTAPWEEPDVNDLSDVDTLKMIPFSMANPPTNYGNNGYIILTIDGIKFVDLSTGAIHDVNGNANAGSYGTDWVLANAQAGYTEGVEEWAQYGDFLVITNGISFPLVIYTTGSAIEHFIWTNGELPLGNGALLTTSSLRRRHLPFDPVNTTATTITINTKTVGTLRILTASTAIFYAGMVGQYIKVYSGGVVGWGIITVFTDTTHIKVTVLEEWPDTIAYTSWMFSQWGGSRGYPRAVSFFENRLCFYGNDAFPDRVWCSQIGDLYELSLADPAGTPGLSDCFAVSLGQNDPAVAGFLFPKENLFAVSSRKESYLDSIDDTLSIGFGNTRARNNSARGGAQRQPQALDNAMLYAGNSGNRILELVFNLKDKGYIVADLSRFTPDITRDRALADPATGGLPVFKTVAATQNPDLILWCLDSSGRLYSVTRDREANTFAWAHHVLGGSYASGEPKILDICVVDDQLCLAVVRAIGSEADMICFETLNRGFYNRELLSDAGNLGYYPPVFFDYSCNNLSVNGSGVVSGLGYLEGATVSVIANGNHLPNTYTVSSGQINLGVSYASAQVIVGFNYESLIVPSALESNALFGSGLGAIKRTEEVTVLFERTVAAKIGVIGREDEEVEIQFRPSSVAADDPIPLFSGEKKLKINASYEGRQNVYVKQDKGYPMTVNAVISKGILYD